ncbi:MAG: hypothetical protein GAK34_02750 [Delftia tsuruhatensis]|nr:MAG: hypothetical protein GAK34_02750 [Delftia tsuruhatensis]
MPGAAAVAHLHAARIDGDQHRIVLQRHLEARAQHGDLYVRRLDHEGPFRVARHGEECAAGQQPHLAARGVEIHLGAAGGVQRQGAAVGQGLVQQAAGGRGQPHLVLRHPLAPGQPDRRAADTQARHPQQGGQGAAAARAWCGCGGVSAPAVQRGFHAVHGAHDFAFHGFDRDAVALGQLGMRGALDAVGQEDVAAARGQLRQGAFDPGQGLAVGMGVGHIGAEGGGRLAFPRAGVKALGRALAMAQVVDGDVLHHRVEIGAAGAWRTVRRGGRIAFAALAFGQAYPGVMHQVTRGLRAGAARHEAHQLVVAVLEGAQQGRRGRGGRRHAGGPKAARESRIL